MVRILNPTNKPTYQCTINTGDARPMRYSPYTISPQQHDVIDAHVKEMSDEYIIEPSTSG